MTEGLGILLTQTLIPILHFTKLLKESRSSSEVFASPKLPLLAEGLLANHKCKTQTKTD